MPAKKKASVRNTVVTTVLKALQIPADRPKFVPCDSRAELADLARVLCEQRSTHPPWRSKRAYVLAERASLVVQCPDEEALGLWLAALRALLAERLPPSPIGPAALQGAFGCDLEEVALADASLSRRDIRAGERW